MFKSFESEALLAQPRPFDSVLVIEDNGLVALMIEDLLRERGASRLLAARDPRTALELAKNERLDFAILDIAIWGDLSYDIADTLAARGIPFLFCTGFTGDDIASRHRNRPVVFKPFADEQFRAAVAAALAS